MDANINKVYFNILTRLAIFRRSEAMDSRHWILSIIIYYLRRSTNTNLFVYTLWLSFYISQYYVLIHVFFLSFSLKKIVFGICLVCTLFILIFNILDVQLCNFFRIIRILLDKNTYLSRFVFLHSVYICVSTCSLERIGGTRSKL